MGEARNVECRTTARHDGRKVIAMMTMCGLIERKGVRRGKLALEGPTVKEYLCVCTEAEIGESSEKIDSAEESA